MVARLLADTSDHVSMVPGVNAEAGRDALLLDAYTGHAGSVTALLCDSVTTRSGGETAGVVPQR